MRIVSQVLRFHVDSGHIVNHYQTVRQVMPAAVIISNAQRLRQNFTIVSDMSVTKMPSFDKAPTLSIDSRFGYGFIEWYALQIGLVLKCMPIVCRALMVICDL